MSGKNDYNRLDELSYSVRRYYVDRYFSCQFSQLTGNLMILDLGGVKGARRGLFSAENYPFEVKYANIAPSAHPDYLCDATSIPVNDCIFDVVILSEVIEHVIDPIGVFREVHRILKPHGKIIMTVPFAFYYHPNPTDFGRYTEEFYLYHLNRLGFENITIEKQGLFWSTIAEMLKSWIYHCYRNQELKNWQRKLLKKIILWFQYRAIQWDKKGFMQNNLIYNGYTTGYGISATKKA
jgi:SAM-dependent methyltransferase